MGIKKYFHGVSFRGLDWIYIVLILVGLASMVQVMPTVNRTPDIDSGIFLYFGSRILHGELPYRDLWDSKPPGIFYINALGLFVSGGSRWGVWLLEFVGITVALLAGYAFLKRSFGKMAAFFSLILMAAHLALVLEGGNLTEEYGLPFQFLIWLIWLKIMQDPKHFWPGFWMGVVAGVSSTMKQTNGGALVAPALLIGLWIVITRNWRGVRSLLGMAIGVAVVWAVWLGYFLASGVFEDFWQAVFAFNAYFIGSDLITRLRALLFAVTFLPSKSPYFLIGVLAWLIGGLWMVMSSPAVRRVLFHPVVAWLFILGSLVLLYKVFFRVGFSPYTLKEIGPYRWGAVAIGATLIILGVVWVQPSFLKWGKHALDNLPAPTPRVPVAVMGLGLLDFVIQAGLVSATGAQYRHYLLSMFPAFSLLVAFAFCFLTDRPIGKAWLLLMVIPLAMGGVSQTVALSKGKEDADVQEVVEFLQSHLPGDAHILSWGWNARLHYLTGFPAVSRYVHQNPLFVSGFARDEDASQFLHDLQTHPPDAIVYGPPKIIPLLIPEAGTSCEKLEDPDYIDWLLHQNSYQRYYKQMTITSEMRHAFRWICEHYILEPLPNLPEWQIYLRKQVP
ncbi:4-amino-4-deoxy-L-arabinose transferase [Anaerolinea thermolimosa]|uniref:ArnT family glycosyltransferase n=1 Tax=Anaerolinea thermolimosa TaxID=229919 RepID=UPI000784C10B|nr:glycosyltransferase family 39 protein [Anaerolinea thermolimosa]GAP05294.1 4-amino-4-deoxy-L-arabinose transferase [Anaerolinea thermolimosa]